MLSVNDDDIAKPYRSIYVPISAVIAAKYTLNVPVCFSIMRNNFAQLLRRLIILWFRACSISPTGSIYDMPLKSTRYRRFPSRRLV